MAQVKLRHPPYSSDEESWPENPSIDAIKKWEIDSGKSLPSDYKSFMAKYNGGALYPLEFKNNVDEEVADENDIEEITGLDLLFDWNTFAKWNSSNPSIWAESHVVIGLDSGSNLICISTDGNSYGRIIFWWRNAQDWDVEDDGPLPIGIVANDFREFVFEKLFVSEDGGSPRWQLPGDLEKAEIVEL
ncbi:SMI1/KNR4 family protein [Paracoccus onubensis]|uniref:SMI1/KNR4 family protein n=1 Tax=Paracoccus onubensis TaxID=1675788 RepID=A0A418SNR2_9RHOB|nr:SMI1/KNR4 family protein [Paracoccus onubensis]RJE82569.1 SMI1/KNR4 family protein [Paracoccus onubensis]